MAYLLFSSFLYFPFFALHCLGNAIVLLGKCIVKSKKATSCVGDFSSSLFFFSLEPMQGWILSLYPETGVASRAPRFQLFPPSFLPSFHVASSANTNLLRQLPGSGPPNAPSFSPLLLFFSLYVTIFSQVLSVISI